MGFYYQFFVHFSVALGLHFWMHWSDFGRFFYQFLVQVLKNFGSSFGRIGKIFGVVYNQFLVEFLKRFTANSQWVTDRIFGFIYRQF